MILIDPFGDRADSVMSDAEVAPCAVNGFVASVKLGRRVATACGPTHAEALTRLRSYVRSALASAPERRAKAGRKELL